MKPYFILLAMFFLALSQGVFLSFNLVLLAVLFWAAVRPPKEALLAAFFAGLFLDLVKGTTLGLSSLVLLIVCCWLLLYRRKLDPFHLLFWPLFVFLSANLYSFIINRLFNWREGLVLALLAILVRSIIKRFSYGLDSREIRLKV